LFAENAALSKELDKLRHLEQLRAASNRQNQDQSQQDCGVASNQQFAQPPRQLGFCFRCGQMGHLRRNCPVKSILTQQNVQKGTGSYANIKGVLNKNEHSNGAATYLHAKVGKHVCDCLLDTGSDITLIPANMVKQEDVRPTLQTLSAANGTEIPVLGEVSLPFCIGHFKGVVSGLVSKHIAEVMLGIDWMTDNAVTWEFERSRIKIGKSYYRLKCRSNVGSWCRRVVLQGDVIIPSRSEVDLTTNIVVRRLTDGVGDTGFEWETEPRVLVPGVHVSRTVIPGYRFSNIPIRAMNVRSEDVMLKVGTNVTNLNPVSVLGCFPVGTVTEP